MHMYYILYSIIVSLKSSDLYYIPYTFVSVCVRLLYSKGSYDKDYCAERRVNKFKYCTYI